MKCLLISNPPGDSLTKLIKTQQFLHETVPNFVISRIQSFQPDIFILDESMYLYVKSDRFVVNVSDIKKVFSFVPDHTLKVYLGAMIFETEDGCDKKEFVRLLGVSYAFYDTYHLTEIAEVVHSHTNYRGE